MWLWKLLYYFNRLYKLHFVKYLILSLNTITKYEGQKNKMVT